MKRLFSLMLIASALTIFSMSSCKKENATIAPQPPATPFTIHVVASNWIKNGNGIYVSSLKNIIPLANANADQRVRVYLVENNEEILINYSPITFMGNELWATNSQRDIEINYRSSQTLPFGYLNIKIAVE